MEVKPRYYTLKQLAEYSGLSVATLRRYINSKGLPYFKINRRILVRIDEFDQWMEKRRKKLMKSREDLDRIVNEVLKDFRR